MSESPTLAELQEDVRRFRDERDWRQFHTLKDLAAALAIEAAELQQELLWVTPHDERARLQKRRAAIEEELADVVASKNGIVQVGTELRNHKKIAKKHLGLLQAVGAMRNVIEHGIDNDEGKEWQITAQGLRLFISSVMLGIKSIGAYNTRADLDL